MWAQIFDNRDHARTWLTADPSTAKPSVLIYPGTQRRRNGSNPAVSFIDPTSDPDPILRTLVNMTTEAYRSNPIGMVLNLEPHDKCLVIGLRAATSSSVSPVNLRGIIGESFSGRDYMAAEIPLDKAGPGSPMWHGFIWPDTATKTVRKLISELRKIESIPDSFTMSQAVEQFVSPEYSWSDPLLAPLDAAASFDNSGLIGPLPSALSIESTSKKAAEVLSSQEYQSRVDNTYSPGGRDAYSATAFLSTITTIRAQCKVMSNRMLTLHAMRVDAPDTLRMMEPRHVPKEILSPRIPQALIDEMSQAKPL